MDGLVDTSVLVDMLRSHAPALAWGQLNSHLKLAITPVVWLEVIAGSEDKWKQSTTRAFLSSFAIAYLTQVDFEWAMRQFPAYRLSHNVDVLDVLIASVNYRLQLPLYTRNLKHFTPLLGNLAQQPY